MGGKSTLLRQVCLAVILAQVGVDVPAESFELSPVDRIFVRMGAKDHIIAGQRTFLTELSETTSMLSFATQKSLVALDELGRGTSTSDGQAIAESVLEHLVHTVKCRGMFSTHYHRLAVDYQKDSKVSSCHMGCKIGKGIGGVEEVTFLYRAPDSILKKVDAKLIEFEAKYGKHNKISEDKSAQSLEDEVAIFIHELMNVASNLSCDESSERIDNSTLIQLHSRENMLLQQT